MIFASTPAGTIVSDYSGSGNALQLIARSSNATHVQILLAPMSDDFRKEIVAAKAVFRNYAPTGDTFETWLDDTVAAVMNLSPERRKIAV